MSAADVGAFQRRCVIHPVTGDGDDFTLVHQCIDDQHLLFRRNSGEKDLGAVEDDLQLGRRHPAQGFAKHHRRIFPAHQPDVAGDGERRMRVIAGDHDHLDAGRAAAGNGLGHLGARRVVEADQAGQDQLPLRRHLVALKLAKSKGQHAQPAVGHRILCSGKLRPPRLIEWHDFTALLDPIA
jgi:hypothetical protein